MAAQWELWERTTPAGGYSTFFSADHEDAKRWRQRARQQRMTLIWTTEASSRREAERALAERQGPNPLRLRPHILYTPRVRAAMKLGEREALALHQDFLAPEHVLLGLTLEGEGVAASALARAGVTADTVRSAIAALFPPSAYRGGFPNVETGGMKTATEAADGFAEADGQDEVSTGHLLLGLLEDRAGPVSQMLGGLGIDLPSLRMATRELIQQTPVDLEAGTNTSPKGRLVSMGRAARLARWLLRFSPVRPIRFWLRTRHGVTTPLMDNWAPVNLRYVNSKQLAGTIHGEEVDLRIKRTTNRVRVSGSVAGTRSVDVRARIIRRSDPQVTVEVHGIVGADSVRLHGTFQGQDPSTNMGNPLADGRITGTIGDYQVELGSLHGVATSGTRPSIVVGLKGSLAREDASVLVSLLGHQHGQIFHGYVHGTLAGEKVELTLMSHPRTVHMFGVCEASPEVVVVLVSAVLRFA